MRLGRAIHAATLEPDVFPLEFVVFDGPRRAGKEWEEFALVNAARTVLKRDEYETALDVRDAVRAHKAARRLLRFGKPEVSIQWTDPQTRIKAKARLDWLAPGGVLVDLKSTRDIDARTFGRLATSTGYVQQLAFYRMGLTANGAKDAPVYVVAVEADEPHDVAVFQLDDDVLYAGEEMVRELLAKLKDCRRKRRWPGRYETVQPLDVPPWFFGSRDDELTIMGLKAKGGS